MKLDETLAMEIPAHLLSLTHELVHDQDELTFHECISWSATGECEPFARAMRELPVGHPGRAEAVAEMRRYLELVEYCDGLAA
jgi:hypothetical protein